MSQNLPPNQPGNPDESGGTPENNSSYGYAGANPYYGQQATGPAPDLDANAPTLKSSDVQRLNRKALLFLGGIVLLLIVAALWMFNAATSGEDKKPKVEEEVVNIPDLPKTVADPPPLPVDPLAGMPPLPVVDQAPPPMPMPPPEQMEPVKRGPSLLERRISGEGGGGDSGGGSGGGGSLPPGVMSPEAYAQAMMAANGQGPARPQEDKEKATSAQPIYNPDTLLVRGTYIRCVMETRIVTDLPGFTSCVVTEPTYSINGRRLLLPKGSKVSGRYQSDNINGPRVSVIWDRITTPNGIDVNMASPGIDNLGGAGHPGDYNAHWGSRIASALLISLISDAFKYAAAKNGPESSTVTNSGNLVQTPYESNTAQAMERLANQALDKSINRPPTVTINQGTVVNIYVAKDVDFSSVLR